MRMNDKYDVIIKERQREIKNVKRVFKIMKCPNIILYFFQR